MEENKKTLLISKQKELIKTYEDHIKLLIDEINELISYAWSHGWASSRFEQGKKNREKINKIKEEIFLIK
jgi:SHS2 domain-containing protein